MKGEDLLSNSAGKIHENEMCPVVQIVLAALVYDADQIVLGGLWIRENSIDLAEDKGCFIATIVDAQRERLRRVLHDSFR